MRRGRSRSRSRGRDDRRARTVLALLVLASFTVITFDAGAGARSPVDPLRSVAGDVFGPIESAVADGVRPVATIPGHFADVADLRQANDVLRTENARLLARLRANPVAVQRADQVADLGNVGAVQGLTLVAAQVVALGPAQSFAETVTIDVGTSDGVTPDMTVLNADGLVGRVLSADTFTSTVLLILDAESVVGGRLGSSMELGFLEGASDLSESGSLTMMLVDREVRPAPGDTVVTWGSRHHAPYAADVPVGQVTSVRASRTDLSTTAVVAPFVDFSALDVVGVVVGAEPRPVRNTLSQQAGDEVGSP